jgi:glucose/mannose-6-phosphate isomerase
MMITDKYPEMISEAIENAKNLDLPKFKFDKIVFCGIGGSLIVGNFIKDLLKYDCEKPIEVFGDYQLPKIVDKKTLVVFISYSGNTEEPLNQFVEALERKCKIIGVTSGGKLEEWFTKLKLPLIRVPKNYPPRYAALSMLISIVMYFDKIGLKNFKKDIEECKEILKKIDVVYLDKIAGEINNSDLAIYAPHDFESIARRFKNDFNENSKLLVVFDTFPEMDHNDIDGFENPELNKNRSVLLIRDRDESFEMKNRIEITKDIIGKNVKSINEIWTYGESKLAKIVSLIFIGSYISCKLAELNGIDAEKIEFVDKLKKELKERINLVDRLEKKLKFK